MGEFIEYIKRKPKEIKEYLCRYQHPLTWEWSSEYLQNSKKGLMIKQPSDNFYNLQWYEESDNKEDVVSAEAEKEIIYKIVSQWGNIMCPIEKMVGWLKQYRNQPTDDRLKKAVENEEKIKNKIGFQFQFYTHSGLSMEEAVDNVYNIFLQILTQI